MAHVYFTSYARLDTEGTKLQKAFEKLKARVRALLGLNDPKDIEAMAFIDAHDIQTGEDWQQRLAAAVHQARVLVCFLSPTYFNSEWCAKEFAVFRRRLAQLDGAAPLPRAIIPVRWEVGFVPGVVAQHQFTNDRFPAAYATQGLRSLFQIKSSRDDAEKTIEILAEAIRDAAASALPTLDPAPDFSQLPRSFENPGPYGIALVALTARGPQTRIGLDDTIARIVDRVANKLQIPWREIPPGANLLAAVTAAVTDRTVVVAVTDDASAQAEPLASYLGQLQGIAAPLIVLVGTNAAATDDAAARAAVPGLAARGIHAIESFSLGNADSLAARLTPLVIKRRTALVDADPLVRIADPQLADAADRDGIAIASRPGLRGPGGATT